MKSLQQSAGFLILMTAVATGAAAQGARSRGGSGPVPAQTTPSQAVDEQNARITREQLQRVLSQYAPSLEKVLQLDPSLLHDPEYLAPYPALSQYLSQHPEIGHNPAYFLGVGEPWIDREASMTESYRLWRDVSQGIVHIPWRTHRSHAFRLADPDSDRLQKMAPGVEDPDGCSYEASGSFQFERRFAGIYSEPFRKTLPGIGPHSRRSWTSLDWRSDWTDHVVGSDRTGSRICRHRPVLRIFSTIDRQDRRTVLRGERAGGRPRAWLHRFSRRFLRAFATARIAYRSIRPGYKPKHRSINVTHRTCFHAT